MALRIHSLDEMASRVSHAPAPAQTNTTSSQSSAASQASSQPQGTQAPSFSAVFAQSAAAAAAAGTTATAAAPAAASSTAAAMAPADDPAGPLFGSDPWLTDPTGSGPGGTVTHYNPVYFATQQTAQTVAQMLGGTVVQADQITTAPGSPFTQDESNYMVQLPGGGLVNPGFIADIYSHGWSQSLIDEQVANEVTGAEAAVSN